ncbi:MAG TPA: hypothetical protein VFW51_04535, partial [Actinomycetota bacterium]|nr:hypothetical protein [Actinomycetota bacterium]
FEDASVAEQARELLAGRHPGVEREGTVVRFSSNEGPRLLVDVLRVLDGAQLAPATLAVHEPSLDDVFLSLTGRHAEEIEAAEEPAVKGRRRRRGAA